VFPSNGSSSLDTGNTFNNKVLSSNSSSLVKTTNIHSTRKRDSERFGTEDRYSSALSPQGRESLPYFCKATREALTAKDNSIGSSGGTTEVMMRIQSSKSLPFAIPLSNPIHQLEFCYELGGEAYP
jgi:hypothetical protein